jgi:Fe-S-cluster-containing dehydrogenase component
MSRPSSGYDYTFVRVEDFDYAKEISIEETCNDSVKTLLSQEDKLTTPNMCLNRISSGDSSQAAEACPELSRRAAKERSPQRKPWVHAKGKGKSPGRGERNLRQHHRTSTQNAQPGDNLAQPNSKKTADTMYPAAPDGTPHRE